MRKYQMTPEHAKELERIKQKYINNARRTDAMTDFDKSQMRVAMRGLYKNANLPYPGDDKIIFVASPLIAQFASGFAMALIHRGKGNAEDVAWDVANATRNAANVAENAAEKAGSGTKDAALDVAKDAVRNVTQNVGSATRNVVMKAASAARNVAMQAADNAVEKASWDAANAADNAVEKASWDAANAAMKAVKGVRDVENVVKEAAEKAARDVAQKASWDAANVGSAARSAALDAEKAAEKAASASRDSENVADRAVMKAADRAAWDAENVVRDVEKKNCLDVFLSAFIRAGSKYGKFGFFSASLSWRYRARSAFYPWYQVYGDFFKNVAQLPGDWEKWDPLNLDCLHGGVRFMTPEFTIISDRPEILNLNDQGQLHCENGPAVKWRDGMVQYYWNGTAIPDRWIEDKDCITPEIALTWDNMEQRRCAAEIVGWHNVLEHPSLNPKVIDTDDDPQIGQLIEVDLPEIGRERFLKVQCGTGRTFALPVPPDSQTALSANAWTYGLDDFEYKPEVRT